MAKNNPPGARRVVPRSRGALSGIALMALGAWGALIPFIGPYFNFSFTPDDAWHWTSARGWLEVLPGAAAFVAGFLLLVGKSRTMTLIAAWLGIAAGAWFVVGLDLRGVWHIGSPGSPAGSGAGIRALEVLAMFTLLGVVIVYFAATAFGRLSVVSLRDAHAAERREAAAAAEAERERETAAARDRDEAAAREREAAERERDAAEAAAAHERTAASRDDTSRDDTSRADPTHTHDTGHDRDATVVAPASVDNGIEHNVGTGNGSEHDAGTANGAHAVTQATDQQAPDEPAYAQQPQQGFATPQQGYAQPQNYDPQHGYAQQAPADQQAEPGTEHESLGRRLFHRR